MKILVTFLVWVFSITSWATELHLTTKLDPGSKLALEKVFQEAFTKLPASMQSALPETIHVQVTKLKGKKFPTDICAEDREEDEDIKREAFIYGSYNDLTHILTLNQALIPEIKTGREQSAKLSCQHKSIYDQIIATVIHELGHAYDAKVKVSKDHDFLTLNNFGKRIIRRKNNNLNPLRSPDEYEITNAREAFAVNLEYFTMDPEFACRKPSTFDYYEKHFGIDPYPQRTCRLNPTIMLTSSLGALPVKLDLSRVYRVDYLHASKGNEISSGFGHSMYRLVICAPERTDLITGKTIKATPYGPKCVQDRLYHVVLSYRANSGDAPLNYLKGMMGGYPSMLFILNFSDVLEEYNKGELRDVVSYPIKFTEEEKQDFLKRMLEEHWNYSGSYKFIVNNCATESLKLLREQVEAHRAEAGIKPTLLPKLTPNALRGVLARSGLIDLHSNEMEKFDSQVEPLIKAYEISYGEKFESVKAAKKALVKFADNSTPDERKKKFEKLSLPAPSLRPGHDELQGLKGILVTSASFSLIEQQVARMKGGELKKKLSEFSSDKDNYKKFPELKDLRSGSEKAQIKMKDIIHGGYGVPLENEVITISGLESKLNESMETINDAQDLLKKIFPDETHEFELISDNLKSMNKFSLQVRKEFRQGLDLYIQQKLENMSDLELGHLMNEPELTGLRDVLGKGLVTSKEVSSAKLRRMVKQAQVNHGL
jgi:predicted Zn-dependent protease with MMP-like domain